MSDHLPTEEPPEDSAAHRFGALIRKRSADLGVDVTVAYERWAAPGGYIVHINGAADLLFEVDDWAEGVRVMDPHGEDVTDAEAVNYFAARAVGHPPEQARLLAFK